MFFKNQHADEASELILGALSEYQSDLERGNYETLEYYSLDWTEEEIWAVIEDNLKGASEKLPLSPEELTSFSSQLKKESSISFAQIAQLFASLNLLMNQKQVKPEEELKQLNTLPTVLYIRAAMPGLCLVELNAVETSPLKTTSKLSTMSQTLHGLGRNKEAFGALSDLVIQVAVQRYLELFEQLDTESRKNYLKSVQRNQDLVASCFSIEEAQEKLTTMEKCTLKVLEKLNNSIGKINFPKQNVVTILEDN